MRRARARDQPFVAINCAAVPENLLESELFGHVRGAFTGALGNNPGKFALASGRHAAAGRDRRDCPLMLQPKLLRVLQEREFYRLGDSRPPASGRAGHRLHQPSRCRRWWRRADSAKTSTTG